MNVVELSLDLIRQRHLLVKNLFRYRNKARMRYPGAIMSVRGFSLLVSPHLIDCQLIRYRICLDWYERCHAADGVNTTPMAGLNEQFAIGAHEVCGHRHSRTIGKDK